MRKVSEDTPPHRGQDEPRDTLKDKTVCLDFDGVLHSYTDGWQGEDVIGDPEPGAIEFVQKLLDEGANVVIQSRRAKTEKGRKAIRNWLDNHDFPHIDEILHTKPTANFYVDDRAVPYVDSFDDTLEDMRGPESEESEEDDE